MYKPLPKEVTIKKSPIEGLGLFAVEDISNGHNFGRTHVSDVRFENGFLRTPLGGFVNHSETPNCELISKERELTPNWINLNMFPFSQKGKVLCLVSKEEISAGTELTTKYSLYNYEEIDAT